MSDRIEVKMGLGVDRAPKGADAVRTMGGNMVHSRGWVQECSNERVNYSAQVDIFSYNRLPLCICNDPPRKGSWLFFKGALNFRSTLGK